MLLVLQFALVLFVAVACYELVLSGTQVATKMIYGIVQLPSSSLLLCAGLQCCGLLQSSSKTLTPGKA